MLVCSERGALQVRSIFPTSSETEDTTLTGLLRRMNNKARKWKINFSFTTSLFSRSRTGNRFWLIKGYWSFIDIFFIKMTFFFHNCWVDCILIRQPFGLFTWRISKVVTHERITFSTQRETVTNKVYTGKKKFIKKWELLRYVNSFIN